ncbi:MAG: UxaA family hydrolase [Desulfovibrio sp.]|uniref:UxaA family hydrolase n=1 Tax=Desulfovibrio sp. TaxID=885 RepID=UPI0025BF1FEB|nr:UxaA family hydrolase [Desulfovibrio sp.]MCI7568824.1 UxaA family hydrolase [Desulfovibrio sp.]
MALVLALKVNDKDNVATLFAENVCAGTEVEVRDKKGNSRRIVVNDDIPYGHKLALEDIPAASPVIKYGEELGIAHTDIRKGDYVHVHNLDSMRGRGDLA